MIAPRVVFAASPAMERHWLPSWSWSSPCASQLLVAAIAAVAGGGGDVGVIVRGCRKVYYRDGAWGVVRGDLLWNMVISGK